MASEIKVDTISEKTAANGVTIDGVLIKDGEVDGVDVSAITQGITVADQWRLTANITNTSADITSNLERIDNTISGIIGSGVTESSGIFSFPSTGIWLISVVASLSSTNTSATGVWLVGTNDNFSSEFNLALIDGDSANSGIVNFNSSANTIIDVTDISNIKVKLQTVMSGTTGVLLGNTGYNRTSITFIRLGDT